MSRYIGDIILEARRDSNNVNYSSTSGISDDDFVRYANYGLQKLQGELINLDVDIFRKEQEIAVVADQREYTPADNIYLATAFVDVQYSPTGNYSDYYEIPEVGDSYRNTNSTGSVSGYNRRAGKILPSGIPSTSTGSFLLVYDRAVDNLNIRVGKISAQSLAVPNIDITLDSSADTFESRFIANETYVCITSAVGVPMAYNGLISAYNSGTNVITFSALTLESGFVATDVVGAYITLGRYTTTHFKGVALNFEDLIDRYIHHYMTLHTLARSDSNAIAFWTDQLSIVEGQILNSFRRAGKDEEDIMISNIGIMNTQPRNGRRMRF